MCVSSWFKYIENPRHSGCGYRFGGWELTSLINMRTKRHDTAYSRWIVLTWSTAHRAMSGRTRFIEKRCTHVEGVCIIEIFALLKKSPEPPRPLSILYHRISLVQISTVRFCSFQGKNHPPRSQSTSRIRMTININLHRCIHSNNSQSPNELW